MRRRVYLCWWREGRGFTERRFKVLYGEWKKAKEAGDEETATLKYERIRDLGIAALPYLVEKVEEGEKEFVPVISYLSDGEVREDAGPADCVRWWREHKARWTVPFPEKGPDAAAEGAVTVR